MWRSIKSLPALIILFLVAQKVKQVIMVGLKYRSISMDQSTGHHATNK